MLKNSTIFLIALTIMLGCANPKPEAPRNPQARANSANQQLIYIGREIQHPGSITWTSGMTLKDAIDAAGGLTPFAGGIIKITHSEGLIETVKLDSEKNLAPNPTLKPGDIIHIVGAFL